VPDVSFKVVRNGEFTTVGSDEIFKGRRVVLFALPGAYTPTCSTGHVPRCERARTMLTERGIPFEAIYLGDGISMSSVRATSGAARVPQVFIDGKLIGGADALQVFLDKNTRETRHARAG
jgi:glutaredoxin